MYITQNINMRKIDNVLTVVSQAAGICCLVSEIPVDLTC